MQFDIYSTDYMMEYNESEAFTIFVANEKIAIKIAENMEKKWSWNDIIIDEV